MIEWVYGSGFPKSLNIGKAVDKLQGNEREVIGKKIDLSTGRPMSAKQAKAGNGKNINEGWDRPWRADDRHCEEMTLLTKGTSEWEGWGTALKPAHEPICMARKPLSEKTVAENCLKYGTGGINIDESRVGKECLRVLKPGGHLLSFSGTRTYHRMACAIEDAGFEVRDIS